MILYHVVYCRDFSLFTIFAIRACLGTILLRIGACSDGVTKSRTAVVQLAPKICIKHRKHRSSSFSHTFNCVCWSKPIFKVSKMWRRVFLLIKVQVNLCQKLLFLHQLTHNMTTDCSLFMKIVTSGYLQNILCTQIFAFVLFWHSEQFWYTTCSADVAASEKDLPVPNYIWSKVL